MRGKPQHPRHNTSPPGSETETTHQGRKARPANPRGWLAGGRQQQTGKPASRRGARGGGPSAEQHHRQLKSSHKRQTRQTKTRHNVKKSNGLLTANLAVMNICNGKKSLNGYLRLGNVFSIFKDDLLQ